VKLVASKDEAEVATVVGKALKHQSGPVKSEQYVGQTPRAPYRIQANGKSRSAGKCWVCGQLGHYALASPNKRR